MLPDIQPLTEKDLSFICAIEQIANVAPWSELAFQKCWEIRYPGWVLRFDDEIIGFVMISVAANECHVLNLCLHPDHQRRGHGKKLLIHALKWAKNKGAGMVYLEVRRSNVPAITLYQQMQFTQIGERKNYYHHTSNGPEDALVFARDLGIE
jgi:ribosomal-protein-alanine N-acetyltransferase